MTIVKGKVIGKHENEPNILISLQASILIKYQFTCQILRVHISISSKYHVPLHNVEFTIKEKS